MDSYMYDKEFLKQLDYNREKETYVRITSLDNEDLPKEQIHGQVTGGSVNVDGASAVRRTCSLSLVANKEDNIVTDTYWCYNTKFKLEIGLKNTINNKYPDIIWFKMGIYIITSFSHSESTSNFTISISGKDKMCRLNGEVSGNIAMGTDFGTIEDVSKNEEADEFSITVTKLTINEIIQNAVKEYGHELAQNIIINDLDDYGYELMEYRGNKPMYIIIKQNNSIAAEVLNITFEDIEVNVGGASVKISGLEKYYSFNTLDKNYNTGATTITFNNQSCYVAKIEYGDTAGYHRTLLVYNSDLILNTGETVTSLLDKLKAMLGEFEYFYDLDGRFVFQKKKTYIQELFSPINGEIITPTMYASQYSYKFEDKQLFTTIGVNPNINNVKNDFAVWGTKSSGDKTIHARYGINKKPTEYTLPYDRYDKVSGLRYIKSTQIEIASREEYMEKREKYSLYYLNDEKYMLSVEYDNSITIYYDIVFSLEPLIDYSLYKYDFKNYFYEPYDETLVYYYKNENNNYSEATIGTTILPYYIKYCDKEQSFTNTNYNWRELIYQMALDYYAHNQEEDYLLKLQQYNSWVKDGKTGYEQYYSDMQAFWRELYNPLTTENDKNYAELNKYEYYDGTSIYKYWNKNIHIDPTLFDFWFDFLDTKGELGQYGVDKIGSRSKVVNESAVKSIYYKETPEILFYFPSKETLDDLESGAYVPMQLQDSMDVLFARSAQGMSAISKVNDLIYQYVGITEGISITSIPIYYLQPNTRIYIEGYGDYILDKISYSLNYNGTMNISGNKIMKQFY